MEAAFSSTVAGWQTFYSFVGSASATLVGLLFVAVSLHLDLVGESGISAIFVLARRTFVSFILAGAISLVFLIPQQGPLGLGWPLLVLGLLNMLLSILNGRTVVTGLRHTPDWENIAIHIVRPIVVPLVSGIGLVLVAATVLAGTTSYLYWMVPVVVLILTNASIDTWQLMLGLAEHRVRRSSGQTSTDTNRSEMGAAFLLANEEAERVAGLVVQALVRAARSSQDEPSA
jgi:hypothetical protein